MLKPEYWIAPIKNIKGIKMKYFVFRMIYGLLLTNIAYACSLPPSTLIPSNYELIKETQSVVLAKAESAFTLPTDNPKYPLHKIRFSIIEVLKGKFAAASFINDGNTIYKGGHSEYKFIHASPGGNQGGCNAYGYKLGKFYVLFLNKYDEDSDWEVSGPPFSRINEIVDSPNSPWVKAVREYIKISLLNNHAKENEGLRELQEKSKSYKDKLYANALTQDIENYFLVPYPTKSFMELFNLYEEEKSDSKNFNTNRALWALAQTNYPETKAFMEKLLISSSWEENILPISLYVENNKDSYFFNELTKKYFEVTGSERWYILSALLATAKDTDINIMLKILKSSNEELTNKTAGWFVKTKSEEAEKYIDGMVNSNYSEKYQLSLKLAAMGNTKVFDWAKTHIGDTNEKNWVPYYVISNSPLAEAKEQAIQLIEHGTNQEILYLMQGYTESASPHKWGPIDKIISTKLSNSELYESLYNVLQQIVINEPTEAKLRLKVMSQIKKPIN